MERTGRDEVAVTGVLLAGGRASRMGGRDKAFAAVDGEAIAVRTVRLFRTLFPQVLVATNKPDRFRALEVETVADTFADCGPLAGIHAAMRRAVHPWIFVAACDMPGLDADVIRFLVARIGDADAVVPRWDRDIEPLHAIYAKACLAPMRATLESGRRQIAAFFPSVRVAIVEPEEARRYDPAGRSFLNVNTPEQMSAAERELRIEN